MQGRLSKGNHDGYTVASKFAFKIEDGKFVIDGTPKFIRWTHFLSASKFALFTVVRKDMLGCTVVVAVNCICVQNADRRGLLSALLLNSALSFCKEVLQVVFGEAGRGVCGPLLPAQVGRTGTPRNLNINTPRSCTPQEIGGNPCY